MGMEFVITDISSVTEHSIRWRILKGLKLDALYVWSDGYRAFDPMEDTERTQVQVVDGGLLLLQSIRSDGGY